MALTPQQRTLSARLAAYVLHASRDSREVVAPARRAFEEKFLNEVDPHCILPEEERLRRAAAAMKAHMTLLAFKSSVARAKRSAEKGGATAESSPRN